MARAVGQALSARRPKTRYAIGRGAKPPIAMRWLLSNRGFDGLMRLATRTMACGGQRRGKTEELTSQPGERNLA